MAVGDDPAQRAEFVKLMQEHDPEFATWAATFLTQGQLQPVEVRDNGKRADGASTYTLVFGCRRCLAILYNWCLIGKPREPVVEAHLAKGNNNTLLHRAVIENFRRNQSPLDEARAIKIALNNGQTKKEVADEYGVTVQTIVNRLALLDLPPDEQRAIEEGRMKKTVAVQKARDSNAPPKPKMRPRKVIEQALSEFVEDRKEYKILAWVLGQVENFK